MKRIITYLLPAIVIVGGLWLFARDRASDAAPDSGEVTAARDEIIPSDDDAGRTVISVNGQTITEADFAAAVASLPEQQRGQMASPGGRKAMAEELARLMLLSQEAKRQELDKDPIFQRNLRLQEVSMLANAAMAKLMQSRRGENMEEIYVRNQNEFATIRARHILIGFDGSRIPPRGGQSRTLEAARAKGVALVARINSGESFEAVARAESDDPSAERGGELGILNKENIAPGSIANALFALEAGEVSAPIDAPDGVHIFKVDEKMIRPFSEVRQIVQRQAAQIVGDEIMQGLLASAKIEYDDQFFGPSRIPE